MKSKTKKIIMAALFASLTCVLTMLFKIPLPFKGYINLGDCAVLLSGFLLSPFYGFLAAALGSCIADVFAGYTIYAPVTFIIKGIMAIVAYYGFSLMSKKIKPLNARILSGLVAEIIMVLGYFVFEGFLYGFAASSVNIFLNSVQGIAGLVLGVSLTSIFIKHKILK